MTLTETQTLSSEFDEGLAHLAGENWLEAVSCLRAALRREPGRMGIVRALATAYLHSGDAAAARRVVGNFNTEQPMCDLGWRLAAQLEWKMGQRDKAIKITQRGLELLPNSPVLHRQMALLRGALGQAAESSRHAGRASEVSRIEPWISAIGGRAGDASEMLQPTKSAGNVGKSLDPDYFDRVVQDAKLLEGLINLPAGEGAEADLEMLRRIEFRLAQLVESQPQHADRQLLLAKLQQRIGAIPAATLSVQRAIKANPMFTQAHRLHATLLANAGDIDGAILILQKLVARGIDWPDLHVQLAELHEQRGQGEAARMSLYSAIRSNPEFAQARKMLDRRAA